MRLKSSLAIIALAMNLFAQEPQDDELQKALQNFLLMMEKSTQTLKELSENEQNAIPEEKDSWQLFYKDVKNSAQVKKRNDLLIKTQINYKFLTQKDIPSSTILVTVKDGVVELFGKLYSKKSALKAIDIALHTAGVKEVVSYLIIKTPAKVLL
ncbi:BON domain-containing protein [Nitratiruptor tergarcus]|uniref:Predicted periplasmic or secreted lipoprotein n=1 Tax=Nitratiruptor tergarcus DSM 16512 TaxID=1069081 RepID=A0A1W1WQG1_9BACT|nr:BON domain-containing protein [Nitratiruptor tergarcus]SMC08541.1 Predicted periplasmic or secreted lipoprotein [Nitratiruptor tergarcus DSM 16512]